ncbi:MAG: YbaK/EbsC family protein [Candidatus Nanopelagicales bacterium]
MPTAIDHPSVRRVREALSGLGCADTIRLLPDSARTAAEAAAALGTQPAAIASSIVFGVDPDELAAADLGIMPGSLPEASDESAGAQLPQPPLEPVLVITSGAHRVNTAMVAELLEVSRLHRVDASFVRRMSGFAIGGVAPVGWLRGDEPWQPVTVVDIALAAQPRIWAAAGHPHSVFQTSYAALLRITGGQPGEVG